MPPEPGDFDYRDPSAPAGALGLDSPTEDINPAAAGGSLRSTPGISPAAGAGRKRRPARPRPYFF